MVSEADTHAYSDLPPLFWLAIEQTYLDPLRAYVIQYAARYGNPSE